MKMRQGPMLVICRFNSRVAGAIKYINTTGPRQRLADFV